MKRIFFVLAFIYSSLSCAEFFEIKKKICDGKTIQVNAGERIYINLDQSLIGIGYNDGDVKIVDFNSIVILEGSPEGLIAQATMPKRRTSKSSNVIDLDETSFGLITIAQNENIKLTQTKDCDGTLELVTDF